MNLLPSIRRQKHPQPFSNPLNGFVYNNDLYLKSASTIEQSPVHQNYHKSQSKYDRTKLSTMLSGKLKHADETIDLSQSSNKKYETFDPFRDPSLKNQTIKPILFKYPNIRIVPLFLINQHSDIEVTQLYMKLEKYFKLYFPKCMSHLNKQIINILCKYLPQIPKETIDVPLIRTNWPPQLYQINSSDQFIELINKYETDGSHYWLKFIHALIKIWCLPAINVRKSSYDNIVLQILNQLSTAHPIDFSQSYVLLNSKGQIINDFIHISLKATTLFLASANNYSNQYQQFLSIVDNQITEQHRKQFVGRVQKHFRKSIALDKYDDSPAVIYNSSQRKKSLKKLEQHLSSKYNRQKVTLTPHQSLQKYTPPEPSSFDHHQLQFHIKLLPSLQNKIRQEFQSLHKKSQQHLPLEHGLVYLFILEQNHPVISKIPKNSLRLTKILECITEQRLPANRKITMNCINWRQFIQLSLITSTQIERYYKHSDCKYIIRSFVQKMLKIDQNYLTKSQMHNRLNQILDYDSPCVQSMQEVLWKWLQQTHLLEHHCIVRDLLWLLDESSRMFYMLIVSMTIGTYKTTPLDMAYELLV